MLGLLHLSHRMPWWYDMPAVGEAVPGALRDLGMFVDPYLESAMAKQQQRCSSMRTALQSCGLTRSPRYDRTIGITTIESSIKCLKETG